jgi:hypothetical protein
MCSRRVRASLWNAGNGCQRRLYPLVEEALRRALVAVAPESICSLALGLEQPAVERLECGVSDRLHRHSAKEGYVTGSLDLKVPSGHAHGAWRRTRVKPATARSNGTRCAGRRRIHHFSAFFARNNSLFAPIGPRMG